MTVKFSHERKVRSFAKKTLGSTRVGRAIRLPGIDLLASGFHALNDCWRFTYQVQTEEEVGPTSCGQRRLVRLGNLPSSAEAGSTDWSCFADEIEVC